MMIKMGCDSALIKDALNVSYETIRIYRDQLENKSESFHRIINSLLKREAARRLFAKIEKILEPLALAMEAKTNMRARAKLTQGDFWN